MTPLRRSIAVATAGVALLVLAGAAVVVRAAAILAEHREELLSAVADYVGWPVEAESLSVSWWPPSVVARELRVPDASPYGPGDLAYAEEARFEIDLLPLVRGELVVTEIRLQAPALRVVRGADGGWNLARQAVPAPVDARELGTGRFAPRVVVDTVRLRNGRLSYRDRGIPGLGEIELRSLNLRLERGREGFVAEFTARGFGGPAENVSGTLRAPAQATESGEARLEVAAHDVQAGRLPEMIGALRGRLPFGATLGGAIEARAVATMPAAWPPGEATVDVALDGRQASLRAARGWIAKRAGSVLEASLRLRADGSGLAVERAVLDLGRSALRAEADATAPASGRPRLRFAVDPLDAATLAEWVPALAPLEPSGAIGIAGHITPNGGPVDADVEVRAAALRLGAERWPVEISSSLLRAVFSDDGDRVVASLRIGDVRAPDMAVGGLEIALDGPVVTPLAVTVAAGRSTLRGAAVDGVALECALLEDRLEVRTLRAGGLGGVLTARGSVARAADGTWRVALDPEWTDLDAGALVAAIAGVRDAPAHGTTRGQARLFTVATDLGSAVDNLEGDVDLSLAHGAIDGLNLASTTLESLRSVPRLREALERRAGQHAPDLLARTTELSLASLRGKVAARRIDVARLVLASADYTLDAKGWIGLGGGADLKGTLSLGSEVSRALASEAAIAEVLAGPNGQIRIPVVVRGTYPHLASAPTSDFLAQAMARAILVPSDDASNLLRRLLRGRDGQGE